LRPVLGRIGEHQLPQSTHSRCSDFQMRSAERRGMKRAHHCGQLRTGYLRFERRGAGPHSKNPGTTPEYQTFGSSRTEEFVTNSMARNEPIPLRGPE
jgi:hypothetical protein